MEEQTTEVLKSSPFVLMLMDAFKASRKDEDSPYGWRDIQNYIVTAHPLDRQKQKNINIFTKVLDKVFEEPVLFVVAPKET